MQKKSYFYLSGFISVSIYLTICFLLLLYINAPKPKKFDAFSKTTVLELELISTKSNEKKVAKKSERKEEKIVKKSTSKSNEKTQDLKSLFAKVKTTSNKIAEKEVNAVKASSDPSRYKSKFEKQKKTDNVSVSKLLSDVKSVTNKPLSSSSAKGETHPYYSKIKEILWKRWRPKLLEDGLVVQVIVMITKDGTFDYRIKKYSNNERFDESLKEFLESQKNEKFPPHDIKSQVYIEIEFKSEG
jgi:periplasmic protein TonB